MGALISTDLDPTDPDRGPEGTRHPEANSHIPWSDRFNMPTYHEIKHILEADDSPAQRGDQRGNRSSRNHNRHKYLRQVMARFGYDESYYETLLRRQNGVCAICGQPPPPDVHLHIDHDHKHGPIRGLLCKPCNIAIGELDDDPVRAEAAAAYLRRTGYD